MARDVSDAIADSLHRRGWYAGRSFLSDELTRRLGERADALRVAGTLRSATTGHDNPAFAPTRGDETRWISDTPDDASEVDVLAQMQGLRAALNEALFLGAHDLQMHFARYATGAVYKTHRDVFRDDHSRVVSIALYLNPVWADDAGGELVLYAADDSGEEVTRVVPREGTMACFLSDRFPHEVLPATRVRYSLSGWLRRRRDGATPLRS